MGEITKETMEQYEAIRQSGVINMFNYSGVISIAKRIKAKSLSSLSLDDYKELLMNFGKLMKQFDIKQDKKG
jgi:hypothetical protein